MVSEHGLGGVRVESRNRIDELHYESIRGVHALSYVSVACGLENGAASNLLCKFEKREALEPAGHKAERMIVIQSVKGCQGMLRVIVKRNCIAQDSCPLRGFNLSGYRIERLG